MKITPFNENKFADIIDKINFIETEGLPPEVADWAEFQREVSIIERRKNLDDGDILCCLLNLFRRIDIKKLTDKDAMVYADIADQYGVLTST